MGKNNVPGGSGNCGAVAVLPTPAASTVQHDPTVDIYCVPASPAAGTPWCTVNLFGTLAGEQPADGTEVEFTDAFGALAGGTTLVIVGKLGGVGFQIADQTAKADTVTLSSAGAHRKYVYSGALSAWIVENR